jgi:DNA-binding SARP family transcriptional activator
MGVRTGPYEESVALEPWNYGGPEHANHAAYVAIVDADGVLIDIEDELCELFTLGQEIAPATGDAAAPPVTSVAVSADSAHRALLVLPPTEPVGGVVRVRTLGCMDVAGDPTCDRWLGRRPGRLLKFLICRRYRAVHARDIAEALWGHAGFVSSGTVRQCVHDLRARLEAGRSDPADQLVVTRQSGYALSRSVIVDADDFAVHVRRGVGALQHDQREIAMVHLRHAVAMYRGDFLSDEPQADWARAERDHLREHMEDALGGLAELYLTAGDPSAASLCLRRLAELRPYDADTHRRLIVVLLAQGRRSHAWRCYQAFCQRVEREFATTPGFTLADLAGDGLVPVAAPLRLRP